MTEIEIPTHSFIEKFKATEGALSVCESIAIFNLAKQAPEGLYSEFGTFRGKSAMSAALGLKDGIFYLLEPEFENEQIRKTVEDAICDIGDFRLSVVAVKDYSEDFIVKFDFNDYAYVFVDSGSHQDGLPLREVKLLEDRMVKDGVIVFHDWNSQFKEVKEASDYLVSTGKYEYIPIPWDLIVNHVRENDLEKGNNSWHHTEMEFPCFVGALKRK